MKSNNKSPPDLQPAPTDWLPAGRMMLAGFEQSTGSLKAKLLRLREVLIGDIVASGFTETEANALVEQNFIGMRKPATGRKGLYASPEALRLLHRIDENGSLPRVPDNWVSAHQLEKTHFIGDLSRRNKRLENYRSDLIQDIESNGLPRSEAVEIVDLNLIGKKRPSCGRAALHASPDAVAMMERDEVIQRRTDANFADRIRYPTPGRSVD